MNDRLLLRLVFCVARVKLDGRNRPVQPNRLTAVAGLTLQRLTVVLGALPRWCCSLGRRIRTTGPANESD